MNLEDSDIFSGLGRLNVFVYDIDLIVNPVFENKPVRHVPYQIREEVRQELRKMEQLGVIEQVQEPTPVVSSMVVVKQNGKLRICLDPSEVNKNLLWRRFPLTTVEDIAARIGGSKVFTKLDCKKGFWQIPVTERTSKYLTFGTPWGRYSCKRMPFG